MNEILEVKKKDPVETDLRQLQKWSLSLGENFEVLKRLDSGVLEKLIENDAEEHDLDNEAEDANDVNPLHAELFPGHCSVMLDNIRNVSNILIRNVKLRFHQEEVCQVEIKGYEIC